MYELMRVSEKKQLTQRTAETLIVRTNEEMTQMHINFECEREDYGILSIVNENETMIFSPFCGDLIAGKNWRSVDIAFLDNGCYLFRMELAREIVEFKFVVYRDY